MTTSTIERVAQAIADAGMRTMGPPVMVNPHEAARAALKAIRIPDDRAIAAVEAWSRSSKTDRTWAEGFTVMVDAMLGEAPGHE